MLAFFVSNSPIYAQSYVTLIIDDIGDQYQSGIEAVNLPGAITYALLPNSRFANNIARHGLKKNKEFILHSPMQSIDSRLHTDNTLHIHMTEDEFVLELNHQLDQFPFIKGVNNHMGSLLTIHPGYMTLLMQQLKEKNNLYFIDSRTNKNTIAKQIAVENDIDFLQRHIFLDNIQQTAEITKQFDAALLHAKENGHVVLLAHPYPTTLKVLKEKLTNISNEFTLLTASALLEKLKETQNEKSPDPISTGM